MFNGVDTHEGTETKYWEMTESTEVLQKGSRSGSKSSGSFQHEWHEAPGVVVHVRAKKRSELVPLFPDAVFDDKRLPGVARECGILLVVIIVVAAALTRSPIDRRVRGGDDGGGGLR